MARELWLMRHGKAERYEGIEDYDRNLKKRGKRAARSIGAWLEKQHLIPDLVVASPATRAIATAKIVCNQVGVEIRDIQQEKRLYDEGLVRMRTVLADCAEICHKVLVVAHNPELEELLVYLVAPGSLPNEKKLLPTAALARLELPDDWSQLDRGCARILSITYPNSLLEENETTSDAD